MADFLTLIDNFDDNSLNTGLWNDYGITTETGGRLRNEIAGELADYIVQSATDYTFNGEGSKVHMQVFVSGITTNGTEFNIGLWGYDYDWFHVFITKYSGYVSYRTDSYNGMATTGTISSETFWLRFILTSGIIRAQYSLDGISSWTEIANSNTDGQDDSYVLAFESANQNNGSGYFEIDNVNITYSLATVSTASGYSVTTSSAILMGYLGNTGLPLPDEIGFDYGLTNSYGSSKTSTGTFSVGSFQETITGLTSGQDYHFRAKAHNTAGWTYGADATVTIASGSGGGGGTGTKLVACVGDPSDHGGSLVSHNQNGTVKVAGIVIAVNGASHSCPIPEHGTTSVSAVTTKSYINGKLVLTTNAVAGCGAKITPPNRHMYVE